MVLNEKCVIFTIIILIGESIKVLDAVPIDTNDINFEDLWEYKIKPHDEPLLTIQSNNHILPSVEKRQGKEPDLEDEVNLNSENIVEESMGIGSLFTCSTCKLGAGLFQQAIKEGSTFDEIKEQFVAICVSFNIQTESVCEGMFDVFGPDILSVLNMTKLKPAEICYMLLGDTCGQSEDPVLNWNVKFPDVPKPEIKELDIKPGAPTFKVLHLSDTHVDSHYQEGAVVNCKEPLCCRANSTPSDSENIVPAGKWGSIGKCDIPKTLLVNMLKNIADDHPDIDYIIWTGDIPPHDIWKQTKNDSINMFQETVGYIFDAFPNIPIFPALGNHEGIPCGSFPPPWVKHEDYAISWLYNETLAQWNKWLPYQANNTILQGGFYSVLIRPGFRIISLNMNYGHSFSFWLYLNNTDPAKELQWLIYELQEAENKGEKVHIIGHIPPGEPDCLEVWSRNYYDIIDRYENTVVAQFFGHTHADEFEVFYDTKELKRPTGIAYVAPSITTFVNLNPGYRIYYVDGDHNETTREVIDHETWIMNLQEANRDKEDPKYIKLYSARSAYGMPNLKPKEWDKLINRMVEKSKLFDLFYKYYYKNSPVRPKCNKECKLNLLCDLKTGRSHDRKNFCRDLLESN